MPFWDNKPERQVLYKDVVTGEGERDRERERKVKRNKELTIRDN